MAKASDAYPWQLVMINEILIDCTISENHKYSSEVTEFPVESGSTISDNIRLKPLEIDLDCIISNTPIGEAAATQFVGPQAPNMAKPQNARRSSIVYQRLMDMRDAKEFIVVRTSRAAFKDMVIEDLSIPRDSHTGDAMRFTIKLKHIKIVENQRGKRVAIPMATGNGAKSTTTTPTNGTVHQIAKCTISGNEVSVWFDDEIGLWRKQANLRVFNVKLNTAEYDFVKGALLDGFSGTQAQCVAHYNETLDKNNNQTARTKPMLLSNYTPWSLNTSVGGGPVGSKGHGAPMGQVLNTDGTPAPPTPLPPKTKINKPLSDVPVPRGSR